MSNIDLRRAGCEREPNGGLQFPPIEPAELAQLTGDMGAIGRPARHLDVSDFEDGCEHRPRRGDALAVLVGLALGAMFVAAMLLLGPAA